MRAFSRVHWITLVVVFLGAVGCQRNQTGYGPTAMQPQPNAGHAQMQTRAANLDRINEENVRQLAASRQNERYFEKLLKETRTKLETTARDLALVREEKIAAERQTQAVLASTKSRGGAVIAANNSLSGSLPQLNIAGVTIRRDADVVRVSIISSKLFAADSGSLGSEAQQTLSQVASGLARNYPRQIIGIEGHANDMAMGSDSRWRSAHHLTTARAMAVFDQLNSQGSLRTEQLYIVGYGANQPVYSNAQPAGREANQRIDLVVYPEQPRTAGR